MIENGSFWSEVFRNAVQRKCRGCVGICRFLGTLQRRGRGFLIRVAIRDWCVTLDEVRHVPGGIRNVEKAVEGVSQLGLSCFNFGGTHGLGLAEREIIAAFWQVKTAVEVMCRGGYA
jgi:hypothetical protein